MTESHDDKGGESRESELARLRDRIDARTLGDPRLEMAEIVERDRAASLRLLDRLLDDERLLDVRLRAIEALVTALSTDPNRCGKRGAGSPSQLTPGLAKLARRIGAARSRRLADAALQLSRAAASRAEGPLRGEVIRAIEALKARLGTDLLAANVLDAAVEYNAVMWSGTPIGEPAQERSPDGESAPAPAASAIASGVPAAPAAEPAVQAPARMAEPPVERSSARVDAGAWPKLDAPPPIRPATSRRDDDRSGTAPRRWRVGALVAAAMVGAFMLSLSHGPTLRPFSPRELHELSPLLASGYRDQAGVGPLFVGRLDAKWLAVRPERRESATRHVVDRLSHQGVQVVMLYDSRLRLAAHYAVGNLRSFGGAAPPAAVPGLTEASNSPSMPGVLR